VPLNPEEAVFEVMLAGWARQQRSRFLGEDATIGPRAAVVRRLAGFAGQYPREWEPAEAEAFISHLRSGARPRRVVEERRAAVPHGWLARLRRLGKERGGHEPDHTR
jgi:hypothetical protein